MIRPTTPADTPAPCLPWPKRLASSQMRSRELGEVLAGHFAGSLGRDHAWVTDDDDGPVGVAYYAPERMTVGTWNLYLIAVRPSLQGQGRQGPAAPRRADVDERTGRRLLLVETSGLASFEPTRAFYRRDVRFGGETRIRDFYRAGDDGGRSQGAGRWGP